MHSLNDIITRTSPPAPWHEGDNIPWDDPDFSNRMLTEHLTQDHDLASRRLARIDVQVNGLLDYLPPTPGIILDLACGPGLYLTRLANAGYSGVGIDFSPASIDHARATAQGVTYRLEDLRTADFGEGFDGVLLLYGQLNVFRRNEALSILSRAHRALRPGGRIVIEPQTYEQVERTGQTAPGWSTHTTGLFAVRPHLILTEAFWDEASTTATQRFFVIDAMTGDVTRHALSTVAYTKAQLIALLETVGFEDVEYRPSLADAETDDGLCAVLASASQSGSTETPA